LLFVRERLFRDPLIVSVPFSTVREVFHTAPGGLQLKAEEAHEFDLIRPPSRSWALWWVIRTGAGLGGHS
jgi:hypothetical protein